MTLSAGYLWSAIVVMGAITVGLRALPLLIRRQVFARAWMVRLNRTLPLCVMVVLLAHALAGGGEPLATLWPRLLAEALALVLVVASYWRWRHALASVVIGLVALAAIGRVMGLPG